MRKHIEFDVFDSLISLASNIKTVDGKSYEQIVSKAQ